MGDGLLGEEHIRSMILINQKAAGMDKQMGVYPYNENTSRQ